MINTFNIKFFIYLYIINWKHQLITVVFFIFLNRCEYSSLRPTGLFPKQSFLDSSWGVQSLIVLATFLEVLVLDSSLRLARSVSSLARHSARGSYFSSSFSFSFWIVIFLFVLGSDDVGKRSHNSLNILLFILSSFSSTNQCYHHNKKYSIFFIITNISIMNNKPYQPLQKTWYFLK